MSTAKKWAVSCIGIRPYTVGSEGLKLPGKIEIGKKLKHFLTIVEADSILSAKGVGENEFRKLFNVKTMEIASIIVEPVQ